MKNIENFRYTVDETSEYRRKLMHEIQRAIILLGTSVPAKEEQYRGTYRALVDRHKAYYSLDASGTVAYIESIKHMRMQ